MTSMTVDNHRACAARAEAVPAYERLLVAAETAGPNAHAAARFLGSLYDGAKASFDPMALGEVDATVSDDMLRCLDALRWGHLALHDLVDDGALRVQALCATVLRPRVLPASREWVETAQAFAHPWSQLVEGEHAYASRPGGELFKVAVERSARGTVVVRFSGEQFVRTLDELDRLGTFYPLAETLAA